MSWPAVLLAVLCQIFWLKEWPVSQQGVGGWRTDRLCWPLGTLLAEQGALGAALCGLGAVLGLASCLCTLSKVA